MRMPFTGNRMLSTARPHPAPAPAVGGCACGSALPRVPTCHTGTKEAAEITEWDTHTLLFSHLEIKGNYVF